MKQLRIVIALLLYASCCQAQSLREGFANPPAGYGNVPFYWWNGDTLTIERLQSQLEILSESALSGFAVSYIHSHPKVDRELNAKGYGSFGRADGGNLLCMHGLYYSTHGTWWEWAPPCFHFRMPYWPHMKQWLKRAERMCYLLSQGHHVCDVAILYPTETMQAYPDTKDER